ncbi:WhiB family transcriptional regulator [Mycobacteroides franklinii]|uniref:WhiB family transcriptional regulator n=1 Tax=Mycobacteroides franklinii TaxID=948102 RepID=UPI001E3362F4|nr:WhiB family transcriptional regulator [Mycobacteroides franklinii]
MKTRNDQAQATDAMGHSWQLDARCRGMPTDIFFAPDHQRGHAKKLHDMRAKSICHSCPVQQPCGTYALVNDESHGVWGALTPSERREHAERAQRLSQGHTPLELP